MDRRTFLKTTTAAAATTAAVSAVRADANGAADIQLQTGQVLAAPGLIQQRHEWRIAMPSDVVLADAARQLVRDIEIASAGRIVVQFAETDGDSAASIAAGRCDGTYGSLADICDAPELALFSGLPGSRAETPQHLFTWYSAAGGTMFLDEVAADRGLAVLIAGHSGPATGLWADREIDSLRSFAEAGLTSPGLGRHVHERLRKAFQPDSPAGRAKLQEYPHSPLLAMAAIAGTGNSIFYRDGIHAQGHARMLVLAAKAWNALGPADQMMVRALTTSATHQELAQALVHRRMVTRSVMAAAGLSTRALPADVSSALDYAAREVIQELPDRHRYLAPTVVAYDAFSREFSGTGILDRPNGAGSRIG